VIVLCSSNLSALRQSLELTMQQQPSSSTTQPARVKQERVLQHMARKGSSASLGSLRPVSASQRPMSASRRRPKSPPVCSVACCAPVLVCAPCANPRLTRPVVCHPAQSLTSPNTRRSIVDAVRRENAAALRSAASRDEPRVARRLALSPVNAPPPGAGPRTAGGDVVPQAAPSFPPSPPATDRGAQGVTDGVPPLARTTSPKVQVSPSRAAAGVASARPTGSSDGQGAAGGADGAAAAGGASVRQSTVALNQLLTRVAALNKQQQRFLLEMLPRLETQSEQAGISLRDSLAQPDVCRALLDGLAARGESGGASASEHSRALSTHDEEKSGGEKSGGEKSGGASSPATTQVQEETASLAATVVELRVLGSYGGSSMVGLTAVGDACATNRRVFALCFLPLTLCRCCRMQVEFFDEHKEPIVVPVSGISITCVLLFLPECRTCSLAVLLFVRRHLTLFCLSPQQRASDPAKTLQTLSRPCAPGGWRHPHYE